MKQRSEISEPMREVARLYLRQQREAVEKCQGTSLTECWILTELGRTGGSGLRELARSIGFDKSWTSRAVDALVDQGEVEKKSDPADARRVRLALTRKGMRRYQTLARALDAHAREITQRVPARERKAVAHALSLLRDALLAQEAGSEKDSRDGR